MSYLPDNSPGHDSKMYLADRLRDRNRSSLVWHNRVDSKQS